MRHHEGNVWYPASPECPTRSQQTHDAMMAAVEQAQRSTAWAMALLPDGREIVTAGEDATVRHWTA
ncbi:WD40 repeat domain-containing protein [Streptomyces sp. NRRL S-337]|uniref:WD40 repeat domain-containing protein n=1 Tax=Streptomyces sp. NRRL S-337 TaxID=1463900 RepID=UPI00131B5E7E|nr:WD40 repeat domain-containing protein [Streptomyces sp. NRRL S-337]